MPFDSVGNFTRNYNFTADKNAGIKIRSDRVDAEFDNYAVALNQVLMRDGRVAMSGNLSLAGNTLYGVGAGSVGIPAIRFSGDVTSGVYLPAAGQVGLVAGGVERFKVNSTGAAVTGALTVSSTLAVTGASTLTGNTTVGGTFGVTGVTTFSNDVLIPGGKNLGVNITPVGVGTSQIHAGGDFSFASGGVSLLNFNGYYNAGFKAYTTGYAGALRFDAAGGVFAIYSSPTSATGGAASGAIERFRIDPAGNAGIGTPTLTARLHVAGSATYSGQANVAAVFGQAGTSDLLVGSIGGSVPFVGSQGANPLAFYTNSAERVRIDSNGNVGIGSTSPTNNAGFGGLTLNGTTGGVIDFQAAGAGRARIFSDASSFTVSSTAAAPIVFNTSNTERVRIDASGNLGVLTNNPQAPLHVFGASGRIDNSASQGRFEIWNAATNYGGIGTSGWVLGSAATDIAINATAGRAITFFTNNSTTERARIDTNGNFGVGTGSPVNTVNYGGISVNGTTGGIVSGMVGGTERGRLQFDASVTLKSVTAAPLVLGTNNAANVTLASGGETYLNQAQAPTQTYDVGYLGLPQVGGAAKAANYTAVLADAGQHILFNGAGLTATIPANAAVAYPIGTTLTFVNTNASALTIGITTDTLTMVNSTSTGNRSLAQNCIATAVKVTATSWLIAGSGLT
jgi:hypothetical protein